MLQPKGSRTREMERWAGRKTGLKFSCWNLLRTTRELIQDKDLTLWNNQTCCIIFYCEQKIFPIMRCYHWVLQLCCAGKSKDTPASEDPCGGNLHKTWLSDSTTCPRKLLKPKLLYGQTEIQTWDNFPSDLNLTTLFLRVELPLSIFPGSEPGHPPAGVAATRSPSAHLVYGN